MPCAYAQETYLGHFVYQTSRPQSSVTAPNLPIMVSLCHNLVRLPPISLLQRGKNRSKVPSRKVTIHCPAPRCDSLKVRPMATSERKRGYWQLKTGLQRVHILQNKNKITPISAVDNKKKRFYKTSKLQMATKICGCDV